MPNTQDTPSTSPNATDVKPAAKAKPEPTREQPAQGVIAASADLLHRAKEETTSLAHEVRDVAVESYDSARQYAHELGEDASELTHDLALQTKHIAMTFGARSARFATTHSLPLMLLGTSLGWLTWSIRQETRRTPRVEVRRPQRDLGARPLLTENAPVPSRPATNRTQPSNKLMGVRMSETGYPSARDPR